MLFFILSVPDVSQKHETTRPITLFKDHATYSKYKQKYNNQQHYYTLYALSVFIDFEPTVHFGNHNPGGGLPYETDGDARRLA